MKKINSSLLIFIAALINSGCTAKNVYFNQAIYNNQTHPPLGDSIIRSYQDLEGDFYPDSIKILAELGPYDESGRSNWAIAQQNRSSDKAKQIIKELKAISDTNKPRPLVILIHGFNVSNAEPEYSFARDTIKKYIGNDLQPVYWQVNWDGRDISFLKFRNAWAMAQASGPLVGLKMRGILSHILREIPETPIRIITHSSGAFVAASLLGNNSNALPLASSGKCTNSYIIFCDNIENDYFENNFIIPHSNDMRLLMLAPATPFNSFAMLPTISGAKYQRKSNDGILTKKLTLIVGANKNDIAITKGFLPSSAGGATTLGVSFSDYKKLKPLLAEMAYDKVRPRYITSHRIDFSESKTYNETSFYLWDSHDFIVYLQREAMLDALNLLFK